MRIPHARFVMILLGLIGVIAVPLAITLRTNLFRAQTWNYQIEDCVAVCDVCGASGYEFPTYQAFLDWLDSRKTPGSNNAFCGDSGPPESLNAYCYANIDEFVDYAWDYPDCYVITGPQGGSSSTGGGTGGTGGSSNGGSSGGSNGSQGSNGSNNSQGSQGSNGSQNSQNSQQSQNSQASQSSGNSQQSQNSSCANCRQGSSPGSSAPSSRTSSVRSPPTSSLGPNNQSSASSCTNSVTSALSPSQRQACLSACGAAYMACMEWAQDHCFPTAEGGPNICAQECMPDFLACMDACNAGGGTPCSSASSSAPSCTSDAQCLNAGGTQWTGCASDDSGHCVNIGMRTIPRCIDNACSGEREVITQACAASACRSSSSSSVCPAGYTCMSKEECVGSGQPNNGADNVCGDSTTCCKDPPSNSSASSSASLAACRDDEDCEQPPICQSCSVYQGACVRDCVQRNPVCQQGVCVALPGSNQLYFESCGANECTASSQSSVAISCQNVSDCPVPGVTCTECLPGQGGACARACTDPQVACTNNRCVFTEGPPRTFPCSGNECTAESSSSSSRQSCNVDNDCILPYPSCTSCTKQGNNSCDQLCSFFTAECVNNLCDISEEVRVMSCNANQCTASSTSSTRSSVRSSVSSASSRSSTTSTARSASSRSGSTGTNSSASSNTSPFGTRCDGTECREGGDDFCADTVNKGCSLTNEYPCIQCSGDLPSSSSISVNLSQGSSSSSSAPIILANICDGSECATKGGDTFCGLQNLVCTPTPVDPCIKCVDPSSLSSSASSGPFLPNNSSSSSSGNLPPGSPCTDDYQCSTLICENGFCQPPLPPDSPCTDSRQCSTRLCIEGRCTAPQTLAFLGEVCTDNRQCVTNLCINNLCTACTANDQCASSLCQGGICLVGNLPDGSSCSYNDECQSGSCIQNVCTPKGTLPAFVNGRPVFIPDPSLLPSGEDPSLVLPATVIELPFTDNNGSAVAQDAIDTLPSAPVTPSTGPAALAVMLAGGAAGWLYRRRRS